MIRVLKFLDDLLIFGNTLEEILMTRDSVTPRFCDKFQMHFGTSPVDTVSDHDCIFKDNDFVFTLRKGEGNKESVSGNERNARDNPVRFDKIVWNINFHSSNPPSTSPVSISGTTTNFNTEKEFILHGQSDTEYLGQGGACMVDIQFRIEQ